MTSEPDDLPAFELPEWGTEGAPPPPPSPAVDAEPPASLSPEGPVLSTTSLPAAWRVRRLLGVLTAEGRGEADGDLASATSVAVAAALDRLTEQARQAGADAVTGVRISTVSRKGAVVAIAYGTAVTVGS